MALMVAVLVECRIAKTCPSPLRHDPSCVCCFFNYTQLVKDFSPEMDHKSSYYC